jgi:prepilin-type N-terminal cleavage/methylation domain-containing protein
MKITLRFNQGFTLLELCIASALSSLLLLLLLQSYLSALQTYQFQRALSRLQQQHLFLMQYFKQVLSVAGDSGCYTANMMAVQIYHGAQLLALPLSIRSHVLSGTDVLEIRYLDHRVDVIKTTSDSTIVSSWIPDVHQTFLWIADCVRGEYFRFTSFQSANASTVWMTLTPLKYRYEPGAIVGEWRKAFFYIAKTGRSDALSRSIHGLYRYDGEQASVELDEGIDAFDLSVSYCDAPLVFLRPDVTDELHSVCFIKIHTLLNSHLPIPQHKGLIKTWEGIFAVNH